jgi:hypothetical protein
MEARPSANHSPAPLIFVMLTLWLIALAFVRPLSVDESQYVAATALTAKGLLPYRDFAYLQTPLQPFAFAPLQWVFAGHLLLAMRVTNALLGLVTIMLVHGAARRLGASARAAACGGGDAGGLRAVHLVDGRCA